MLWALYTVSVSNFHYDALKRHHDYSHLVGEEMESLESVRHSMDTQLGSGRAGIPEQGAAPTQSTRCWRGLVGSSPQEHLEPSLGAAAPLPVCDKTIMME